MTPRAGLDQGEASYYSFAGVAELILTSLSEVPGVEPVERLPAPAEPTAAERRAHALALLVAAALHLVVPIGLLAFYALWPVPAPPVEEIPVEVVVEQPPPEPEKPKEKPPEQKPPPEPEIEKPAYDAPRAATPEKVDRDSPDRETKSTASKSEPTPNPGAPEKEQPSQPAPPQEQQADKASPPQGLKPTPDGDEQAALEPAPSDAEPTPEAAPKPAPESQTKAPAGAPLPTIETLPEFKFARAARETPIAGGNADTRYFTIVYGMIRSHMREPAASVAPPSRQGTIIFGVDEGGNLIGRKVVNSSGSANLDMAVMAAIAEAAPYPAPPNWQQRTMRLTYGPR